jgi:ABC-type dipeptide/oligopeptide/nickel transport system permease component
VNRLAFLRATGSRLIGSLASIFGASVISFTLLRLLPGDPARLILGPFASQESVDNFVKQMGWNRPIPEQYITYMKQFFQGDWGISYSTGDTVSRQMARGLPATVELGLFAFLFAVVGALVLALVATYRRRPVVDSAVNSLTFLGLGLPSFWFALMLLVVFYQDLKWFPGPVGRLGLQDRPPPTVTQLYSVDALIAGQWGTFANVLWHLALPTVALGILPMAFLTRMLRANLLDVSREPFLVVVRSKGVGRFTAFRRHALPNAFLPTLTASGLVLGYLLGGSVLVEKVFNWPGVGLLVTNAILNQDFAVVQVFILMSAIVYVVVNFFVDVLYGVLDPRVRESTAVE